MAMFKRVLVAVAAAAAAQQLFAWSTRPGWPALPSQNGQRIQVALARGSAAAPSAAFPLTEPGTPIACWWDDAALRKALDGIELEHVAGLRNAPGPERGVALTLHSEKFRYVYLSDGMVTILGFPMKEYYIVRSGVDFGAICAALQELS